MKIFLLLSILTLLVNDLGFLAEQRKYERVRTALSEKENVISAQLREVGLGNPKFDLMLVAYKDSDELELHVKRKQADTFKLLKTYTICSRSGGLGPKRAEGDMQVPEGFYQIDRFNPHSNFYLSLGINYPNAADRKKSTVPRLGGDIFIHGSCVTIGCLPMTNDGIKEIYLYAVYAKNSGQLQIPIYIFPFRMSDENMARYTQAYAHNEELLRFWANLKTGYDKLQQQNKPLSVKTSSNGDYIF